MGSWAVRGERFILRNLKLRDQFDASQAADTLAQLDTWDIYRSDLCMNSLSVALTFIDLSFKKLTDHRSGIHIHTGNVGAGNVAHR